MKRHLVVGLLATTGLVAGACGTAPTPTATPAPTPTGPVFAEDSKPPLVLRLELPSASGRTSDVITGKARLSLSEGDSLDFTTGGSTFGWSYAEVGGDRQVDEPPYPSCDLATLRAGQTIESPLKKGGPLSASAGPTDFDWTFLHDPAIHLPAGDWRITVDVGFGLGHEPKSCASDGRLSASVIVHVSP